MTQKKSLNNLAFTKQEEKRYRKFLRRHGWIMTIEGIMPIKKES